jgi:signal transduction histidine kinase
MSAILEYLFGAASFVPHGYCLLWRPDLVALHAVSDALIALAYFSIPVGLWHILRQIPDPGFRRLSALFALFILFCGLTHVVGLVTLWSPVYGLLGLIKAATAAISLVAAYLLWPAIPRALAIPGLTDLRSVNQEMGRAIVERRELVSGLSAANRDLDDFINAVAHDLRTPLRCINGFSQMLITDYESQIDAQGRDMLERMRKATLGMGELIDGMLFLSRLRQAPLEKREVDLSAMAHRIEDELRRDHPDYAAELVIQPGLRAECDPDLTQVALRQLMLNAFKFSSTVPHPRIEIDGERDNGRTRLHVRDNGVGFDMQYAGKIFFPFQRLHAAEFPGRGIGLAAVSRIVDRHGGQIDVLSHPGEGTSFTITL